MCNYEETTYSCGCTSSERTELCGYHDEDFAECMNWTTCVDKSDKRACAECTRKQTASSAPQKKAVRSSWQGLKKDDWTARAAPVRGVEVA